MPARPIFTIALALLLVAGCSTTPDSEDKAESTREANLPISKLIKRAENKPDDPIRLYELGNGLFDLRRYVEAREAYINAVSLDSEFADAHTNLGLTYRLLGNVSLALDHYERSLELQPDDQTTLRNIIILLQANDSSARALVFLEHLTDLFPQDDTLQLDLASALFKLQHYARAAESYETIIARDPANLQARYEAGSCYFQLKEWEKAIETWNTIHLRDPNYGKAHLGLAMAYAELKNYDAAWSALRNCQRVGTLVPPEFISKLQSSSGRLGSE